MMHGHKNIKLCCGDVLVSGRLSYETASTGHSGRLVI